ncbi:MAG: hydrolase [Gemmatales bacterium]|nr:MAG: hydrolase [Gemmatales bacterium]
MSQRLFLVWAVCLIFPARTPAQNFGKFLEKTGKDLLRKQFAPETIESVIEPHAGSAEIHTVRTADGWNLVAHRYRPRTRKRHAVPIILCHGLAYNALFWDLDPSCSLANDLADKGFDVWAVSLRGSGLSQKWVWKLENTSATIVGGAIRRITGGRIAPTGYATIDPKFANWTLDDHIRYDVPAFVYLVRQKTGAQQVAWVGHSMGGIVALAHLTRYRNPGIGKLVTVGSQMTIPRGQLVGQFAGEMLNERQLQLVRKQPAQATRKTLHDMFFNQNHVKAEVYEALRTWAKDVPSVGVLRQYASLAKVGELRSADNSFSYARNLKNVVVPILISCGAADQFAPPSVQRYLYDHVGSRDKSLVVFGRAQGFRVDAGHNDAIVGLTSRQQFYPVLEQWLRQH